MKTRRFEIMRLTPRDMTWLFPTEIISRLETIERECGIDPKRTPRKSVPQDQELDALEYLLEWFLSRPRTEPMHRRYDRLPKRYREHLAHLVCSALEAARALEKSQRETPLGFPKGPRGILSNLLSASWIDRTEGGKVQVRWTLLD